MRLKNSCAKTDDIVRLAAGAPCLVNASTATKDVMQISSQADDAPSSPAQPSQSAVFDASVSAIIIFNDMPVALAACITVPAANATSMNITVMRANKVILTKYGVCTLLSRFMLSQLETRLGRTFDITVHLSAIQIVGTVSQSKAICSFEQQLRSSR